MLVTRENQVRIHRHTGGPARHRRPRPRPTAGTVRSQAVALTCVAGSILLWCVGFAGTDPRELGELGLVSQFNSAVVTGLLLLLGSALVCIYQHRPGWVVGTHLATLIVLVHGTPAVLYGTVRYAWSYKHLGVVDYILRTGTVDPGLDSGGIYHNWPGLFAAGALVAELSGGAAAEIALWAPVGINLILLVVLRYVFRGLTGRSSVVWLALLIFFTITWVGQDYFSPQAAGFILYLALVGLLVRQPNGSAGRTVLFTLLVAAMAVAHQITLVILLMAVTALVALRRTRGWYLPVIAIVIILGWALTFAEDYTITNLEALVYGFGQPLSNAGATFSLADGAHGAQRLVAWGDRFTVAAAIVFALIGIARTRRNGTLQWSAVILMLVPVAVLMQMSFGGEALLRVFLFSAPFIAFLAAEACAPRIGAGGFDQPRFWLGAAALVLFVPGFLLGYYGKERHNYFTDEEITASQWVAAYAPAGSLLVEGDTNYPRQMSHHDKFVYVPIAREPSVERLLARPEATLHQWLSSARYTDGYVVITRSQKIGVEMDSSLPLGALAEIERVLTASPRFSLVHQSGDATVFTLSEVGRR